MHSLHVKEKKKITVLICFHLDDKNAALFTEQSILFYSYRQVKIMKYTLLYLVFIFTFTVIAVSSLYFYWQ